MDWREPRTATAADVAAAERAREWWLGWFCDPIWIGDYPRSMRDSLGDRLPFFTEEEKAALLGSADYFG
jgi:beta-glucosidase